MVTTGVPGSLVGNMGNVSDQKDEMTPRHFFIAPRTRRPGLASCGLTAAAWASAFPDS